MKGTGKTNKSIPGNPNLSVLALLVQGSFYKVLFTVGIMAALECVNFRLSPLCFLAALGTVFLILCIMEGEPRNVRSCYTWQRLRITPKRLFLLKTVFNFLCFILLFAVQSGMGIWFCYRYSLQMPRESQSPQLLFLTFYRWEFLHCVLPMAEVLKWLRNLLLILALSMTAAAEPSAIPRKNMALGRACLYIMAACWFVTPIGIQTADIGLCIACTGVCIAVVYRMSQKGIQEKA